MRHVRAVHRLGERATFELIDEIARETGCPFTVAEIAERIAGIDPVLLHITGGDQWPAPPLRIVGGRA